MTKGGIKAGVEAEITYYGDPEDEEEPAMATRIDVYKRQIPGRKRKQGRFRRDLR